MALREGDLIDGKYRVSRLLGRGGMGSVWVAENLRVHRQVAIKVLHSSMGALSDDSLIRFEREAQAAGHIGSDHIVEVTDLGTTGDGDRFMVMELLEGETLKQRMRAQSMSYGKIVAVFRQLLDGLTAAHAAGITHRDLKPDNIFLQKVKAGQRDWVKILDFGISKFSEIGAEGQVTQTGTLMGTPYYMSPEQARTAHLVDARSDLYTVGVILFQALTGQVPFQGTTYTELLFKIVFDPQPHPHSVLPTLDDEICSIVVRAMARDPADRFQSAEAFSAALGAWGAQYLSLDEPAASSPRLDSLPEEPPMPALVAQSVRGEDFEDATRVWSDSKNTSSVSYVASTPGAASSPLSPMETQKSWDGTARNPFASKRRLTPIVVVAALIAVGAVALGVVFFSGSAKDGATPAAAASTPPAQTLSAAPESSAAVPAPDTVAVVATAEATREGTGAPTAPVASTRVIDAPIETSMPRKPPASTKPAATKPPTDKPAAKVVTDFGY